MKEGVHEARGLVDRSTFDLDALLESKDYDEGELVEYVKSRIRFESYPGFLRGPQGTLMAGAGNALDQAVLLANLLRSAGLEADVVEGELSSGSAGALVRQMLEPPAERRKDVDIDALSAMLGRLGADLPAGLDELVREEESGPSSTLGRTLASFEDQASYLVDLVGAERARASAMASLTVEAQNYHWVRYRLGPSEEWLEAHPAFSAVQPPSELTVTRTMSGAVPPELVHRLRLELYLEQGVQSSTRTVFLMSPWEQPVSALVGKPVNLTVFPLSLATSQGRENPTEAISRAKFFVPLLNDALPAAAQAFDVKGRTVPPDALSLGAAGLFQEMSDKMDSATGALSTLGTSDEDSTSEGAFSLDRVVLRMTFMAPEEEAVIVERDLFAADSLGLEPTQAPRAEILSRALAKTHTLMLEPGRYSTGYVLDRSLAAMETVIPVLERVLEEGPEIMQTPAAWQGVESDLFRGSVHLDAYSLFREFGKLRPGIISYRDMSAALMTSRSLVGEGPTTPVVTDVILNRSRTYRRQPDKLEYSFEDQVLAGVWETASERGYVTAEPAAESALEALRMASDGNGNLRVIRPSNTDEVASLALSPTAERNVRRDLADGYVVAFQAVDGKVDPRPVWWRVDPLSGMTLGMNWEGRGQSATEAVIYLLLIALATYVAQSYVDSCKRDGGEALGCTLCGAFVLAVSLVAIFVSVGVVGVVGGASVGGAVSQGTAMQAAVFSSLIGFHCFGEFGFF